MLTSAGPDIKPELLRLLGDPVRAQIVTLLAAEALCTCHLVAETGQRQTNVSNHLRALREAGIVCAEPRGRFTYYRLNADLLQQLADELTDLADSARVAAAANRRRPCP